MLIEKAGADFLNRVCSLLTANSTAAHNACTDGLIKYRAYSPFMNHSILPPQNGTVNERERERERVSRETVRLADCKCEDEKNADGREMEADEARLFIGDVVRIGLDAPAVMQLKPTSLSLPDVHLRCFIIRYLLFCRLQLVVTGDRKSLC